MQELEKLFVPYKESLKLKELGFNESCLAGFFHYVSDNPEKARQLLTPKDSIFGENYLFKNSIDFVNIPSIAINHQPICNKNCAALLYSQAFKFFKDKYNLDSFIKHLYNSTVKVGYYFGIDKYKGMEYSSDLDSWYETYEEAELACLKKLIELSKNQ